MVALVLAVTVGTASAADQKSMSNTSSNSAQSTVAKDSFSLTMAQEKSAWQELSKQGSTQTPPSNFTVAEGAILPGTVTSRPVPADVANRIPALKSYNFAVMQDKLLIVSPSDKKIVDIINKS
jgi:hypothetical protein